jgi:hypothetical protein
MPVYRIYWFDQDDHITEADYLIAEAGKDMREAAAAHLGMASSVEIWRQARCVVRVDGPAGRAVGGAKLPEITCSA